MNKSLAFAGREKELKRLRALYVARKHVVILGPPGIGKTALLQQVRQSCPMLLCGETSSLGRICECLELSALTLRDVRALVAGAVSLGNIQAEARNYVSQIYRLSKGVPRILEELLIEMAARKYKMNTAFGTHLLDLDRRIQELNLGVATTLRPVQERPRRRL